MEDFSQFGQSSVLVDIVRRVPGVLSCNPWIVEYGAGDGHTISNAKTLIRELGFSAVLIEADQESFLKLSQEYADLSCVYCDSTPVTPHNLGAILSKYPIPREFEICCVDIDRSDLSTLEGIFPYAPKVVQIEFDHFYHPATFYQSKRSEFLDQSSLLATVKVMQCRGYSLHSLIMYDAIFIRNDFYYLDIEEAQRRCVEHLFSAAYSVGCILAYQFCDGERPTKGWEFIKLQLSNLSGQDGFEQQILETLWSVRSSLILISRTELAAQPGFHEDAQQIMSEIKSIFVAFLSEGNSALKRMLTRG